MVNQREAQADITREKILETAAAEIYRVGYQAASLGDILKTLGMSKGGLYHHFPNKQALGYAVVDELIARQVSDIWDNALEQEHPLDGVIQLLQCMTDHFDETHMQCGCPINNLAQEMSPIDEGFRQRVVAIYARWQRRLTEALLRAQNQGDIKSDVNPKQVAAFIIATTQGSMGIAKNAQCKEVYRECIAGLVQYLEGLKATH